MNLSILAAALLCLSGHTGELKGEQDGLKVAKACPANSSSDAAKAKSDVESRKKPPNWVRKLDLADPAKTALVTG